MKKNIIKLLYCSLILSFICSCSNNNISSESISASNEDESISSEIIEEISSESSLASSELISESSDISVSDKPTTNYKTNISIGCKYQTNIIANENYFDMDNSQLTDGIFSQDYNTSYTNTSFVGYGSNVDTFLTIMVDLGKIYDTINGFDVSFLNYNQAGILPPTNYEIEYSIDGNDFTSLKKVYISKNDIMEIRISKSCDLDELLKARYILFKINKPSFFVFIDEVSVFANEEPKDYSGVIETKLNDLYANDDTLYSLNNELLKGDIIDKSLKRSQINKNTKYVTNTPALNNHPDDTYKLSDSIINDDFKKGTYVGYKVINNLFEVTFDLNSEYTNIADFEACVYSNYMLNNKLPLSMKISLSKDNQTFYDVGRTYAPTDTNISAFTYKIHLNRALCSRYVKFSFDFDDTNIFYIQECYVYAYDNLKENITTIDYPTFPENILNGSKDIPILYYNTYTKNKYEETLPYVGYLDENGNIIDSMFDGFLYCLTGAFPSGSIIPNNNDLFWNTYQLFKDGQNLSALNKACGDVNKALNTNKKYNVFLSLYLPYKTNAFYYLSQQERNELIESSIETLTSYIDTLEAKFAEANFENLEFAGYYWYSEAIDITEPVEIYNAVSNKIHDLNKSFMWIPYFYSDGYDRWQKYGFDMVYMQPNYAFWDCDATRLVDCANVASKHNMAIEMEMHWEIYSKEYYYQNYMDYLSYGVTYGYMTSIIHTYYFNISQLAVLCYSDSKKMRYLYDSTYKFIKGTLTTDVKGIEDITISTNKNKIYNGKISSYYDDDVVYYNLDCSTSHGSITLYPDGTFDYYPEKDFVGTDSFTYKVNNYLGESSTCTYYINVD